MTNLIDNAIKYQPAGGPVEVSVRMVDGDGVAEVVDHGLGIPAEHRAGLFRPFGRVVTPETSDIPGTGLGLYLSRELARLQGGELELESEAGKGTRVRLSLPVETGG